ncbi:MAG: radical SAM protein [Thermodesulfobacteriota bacterium]
MASNGQDQTWFALREGVKLKKRSNYCLVADMTTGAVEVLHPSEALILSLLDGELGGTDLAYVVGETYGLAPDQTEDLIQKTLKHAQAFLSVSNSPRKTGRRYSPDDFIMPGFEERPGEKEPLESPLALNLVLTRACNFKCRYCFFGSSHPRDRLKREVVLELIASARDLGVIRIDIGGGEPLLYPRFPEIIKAVASAGLVSSLSTNGSRLDERMIESLAGAGLTKLQVSLDAPSAEVHHYMTGTRNTFDRVVAGLRAWKARGLWVKTRSVITQYNLPLVGSLINFLMDLGVDFIDLTPELTGAFECQGSARPTTLSEDQLAALRWLVEERSRRLPRGRIYFSYTEKKWRSHEDIIRCGNLTTSCVVHPSGLVTVCEMISDAQELSYGNIHEDSLDRIWLGPGHRRVLAKTTEPPEGKAYCSGCGSLSFCRTGCFNLARQYHGDFFARDPRCPGPRLMNPA